MPPDIHQLLGEGKRECRPGKGRGRTYHFRNMRRESFRRQGCSSKIFSLRTSPLLYRQSFSKALQMKYRHAGRERNSYDF